MVITESLANGLKNRFFLEVGDQIISSLNKFSVNYKSSKHSPSGWDRHVEDMKASLDKLLLSSYEGGSKGHPYFAFCGLSIDMNREFNSWQEKCLTSANMIFTYEPKHVELIKSTFNISEHAISRLYQRSCLEISNETDINIFSIMKEMVFVPLWASYWLALNRLVIQDRSLQEQIKPVIPTLSGIFLAELTDSDVPFLEIRTFVDDSHLNEDQLLVKKIMLEAVEGVQSSPMAFWPGIELMGVDYSMLPIRILSYRLKKIHRLLGDVVFHKCKDLTLKREFTFKLLDCLEECSSGVTQESADLYKGNLHIREFHKQYKLARLKRLSAK